MFGANSYAFGGAFPSCLKTTCLFAPRGSRNVWAKKTPLPAIFGTHVCTQMIPSGPPPGKLTGTAMLVLGFLVLDWADTVGHIEIARS